MAWAVDVYNLLWMYTYIIRKLFECECDRQTPLFYFNLSTLRKEKQKLVCCSLTGSQFSFHVRNVCKIRVFHLKCNPNKTCMPHSVKYMWFRIECIMFILIVHFLFWYFELQNGTLRLTRGHSHSTWVRGANEIL